MNGLYTMSDLIKYIQERGTVYEIYDEFGPVNQLFCVSQPDFSEAAGMYLMCQNKKASLIYTMK